MGDALNAIRLQPLLQYDPKAGAEISMQYWLTSKSGFNADFATLRR